VFRSHPNPYSCIPVNHLADLTLEIEILINLWAEALYFAVLGGGGEVGCWCGKSALFARHILLCVLVHTAASRYVGTMRLCLNSSPPKGNPTENWDRLRKQMRGEMWEYFFTHMVWYHALTWTDYTRNFYYTILWFLFLAYFSSRPMYSLHSFTVWSELAYF
jgi:hypothetical protein